LTNNFPQATVLPTTKLLAPATGHIDHGVALMYCVALSASHGILSLTPNIVHNGVYQIAPCSVDILTRSVGSL